MRLTEGVCMQHALDRPVFGVEARQVVLICGCRNDDDAEAGGRAARARAGAADGRRRPG